jgi:hypothetical protein
MQYLPNNKPTALACIDELVICNGNVDLAAEHLTRKARKLPAADPTITSTIVITTADILSIITADPDSQAILVERMRVYALIQAMKGLGDTQIAFKEALVNMDSADIARTFTNLLEQISRLTDKHTSNININNTREMIFRSLPPDVAQVIEYLGVSGNQDSLQAQPKQMYILPQLDDD